MGIENPQISKADEIKIPSADMDEIKTVAEGLAQGDGAKANHLINRMSRLYRLNGQNLEQAITQAKDEEANPAESKKVFVN